jgi:N utilization substance protein B
MTAPTQPGSTATGRRSAARMAAAQVLYEMEMAGAAADAVLADHLKERWTRPRPAPIGSDEVDVVLPGPVDPVFLGALVRGVGERREDVDRMIEGSLNRGWTVQRLEVLLRAILRVGVYELLAFSDIPARVVISEHVNVAKAFYAGSEPALVNGVLDRLAHVLREHEFDAPGAGGAGAGES